ncbi:MAG TPA: Plug domain-containing protein, partial [Chthoniobacterales bacterium]
MTTVLPVSAKQKKSPERIAPVLALILLSSIHINAQETTRAPEPVATQLDSVVVTGAVADPLTAPSADTATAELSQVPGGTAVIRAEERQQAAANNVADLLVNQPGVQVRDAGGRNEAGILSVRGAGTNNGGPFGNTTKGVSIFVNGLPVTSPGAYAFEAPDALATDYVEVLRGSSALTYGSLSLGGGIDYVYHTGHNSSPGLV